MNNLNSILVEGNLVRDVELTTTSKGSQVCNFTIASNRYFKGGNEDHFEKEVSFFDVECWGRLAEACVDKGKKGRGVRVVGRLKQSRWTGEDGKAKSKVSIVAEHVEFRPEYKKDKSPADLAVDLADLETVDESEVFNYGDESADESADESEVVSEVISEHVSNE